MISGNTVHNTQAAAYDLEFGTLVQVVSITGNTAELAGTHGFLVANVDGFVFTGNIVYAHGTVASGYAIVTDASATSGRIADNVVRSPGAHSAGNVVDGGGNSVGTNAVF